MVTKRLEIWCVAREDSAAEAICIQSGLGMAIQGLKLVRLVVAFTGMPARFAAALTIIGVGKDLHQGCLGS